MAKQDESGTGGATGTGTQVLENVQSKTAKPKMYKVVFHNDDYTTMEFVVSILMSIFHHTEASAVKIMMHIHMHGRGVAGVFTFEVAETKADKVMRMAREHEYPLRCTVEPHP